ncbi:Macrolide export ATP-binding/permease protein MacB [Cystobacter fuscus DSM 2262]|uniref:Macrolide export ATP-binding/permease protein MacB n=1 Tax=Cystobacter fuscus (strain ATCC 25194 / DSM 2262 / NBRC 100088 / M29) TaxID=1242864 RepID=S9QWD1_CYSF2|nr:ABC transporter permease [Cystobacter fuscus]EPX60988.1 Macrolide export ATP-binding/permease protein MacB [Cystobacter fuscus DSM 2262]
MNILETLMLAVRSLLRSKMRSFLTALGIIIGVGAVIAMVAIGDGARANVQKVFDAMGTNLLIVMPGSSNTGGARGGSGTQPTITWEDLEAIRTQLPSVRAAAPEMRTSAQVFSEDQNWTTSVTGTTPDFFDVRGWSMAQGRKLNEADVEAGAKVAVIGQTVVEKLYGPGINPVGQVIRIKKTPFTIVGMTARKGQSPMGQDYDDSILVPATTFQRQIQSQSLARYITGVLYVQADASAGTARAQKELTALLRERHRITSDEDPNDFDVRDLSEIASSRQQSTETLSLLLASIAAVSLVVGGIGIMNIMLVSVTERTREIGVRVAVGARPRDILLQFLIEALTLSLLGGLLGAAVGLGVARFLASQFQWPLLVRPDVILLALGFSALIGVGFGLYPARKASRLDPIDALRYE